MRARFRFLRTLRFWRNAKARDSEQVDRITRELAASRARQKEEEWNSAVRQEEHAQRHRASASRSHFIEGEIEASAEMNHYRQERSNGWRGILRWLTAPPHAQERVRAIRKNKKK